MRWALILALLAGMWPTLDPSPDSGPLNPFVGRFYASSCGVQRIRDGVFPIFCASSGGPPRRSA